MEQTTPIKRPVGRPRKIRTEEEKPKRPRGGIKKYQTDAERLEAKRASDRKSQAKLLKTNVKCECGGHYNLNYKYKHMKTEKHIDYLNKIAEIDIDFTKSLF